MNSLYKTPRTNKRWGRTWVFICLLGVGLIGSACNGATGSQSVPTVMGVAVVPTDQPTLPPTLTLPPTSTPIPQFTPTPAAATPEPALNLTGTLPPTNIVATPIVIPTNTRFFPTNTPRVPTNTPTLPVTLTFTPSPTLPATNTPTPAPITWRGEYFNNRDLSGSSALVRDDSALTFNWGDGGPASGFPTDSFSARWTRTVQFAPATYRFYVRADDGVRIWLDNDQIINEWHDATDQTYNIERTVSAGSHTIKVEYYENAGAAQIQVWWEQAGQFPQWRGEYFGGTNLQGPVLLLRNDADINFSWGGGAPDSSLPADAFSVRWTRTLSFSAARYRFNATVDDGVRIYVDGALILDEWRDGGERTVSVERTLTAATHLVQVEYYDRTGDARIRVWWEQIETNPYPDWKGEYWDNRTLDGVPTVTRNDLAIDFNWGQGSPAASIPVDSFSCRWTRSVTLEGGRYRFSAQSNDGVRVFVDGNLIINEWYASNGSTTHQVEINLTSGAHAIIVDHYEIDNNALIKVFYERIGN